MIAASKNWARALGSLRTKPPSRPSATACGFFPCRFFTDGRHTSASSRRLATRVLYDSLCATKGKGRVPQHTGRVYHPEAILEFPQVFPRPFRELNQLLAVKNVDEV
jgi:hypothetical protein